MQKKIVVCDIDGTLALMGGRGPFEWDRVGEDVPNEAVINVVAALAGFDGGDWYSLVLISGRMEQCRAATVKWLDTHLRYEYEALYMRPDDDFRPDVELKREIYDTHLADREILCVFDDRDQVVRMWRELDLTCLQVADGSF